MNYQIHSIGQSLQRDDVLSKPCLIVLSINIEGLSTIKEEILSNMCKETDCDIFAIQETHRGLSNHRPKITGMKLVIERPDEQYGSAIFTKPNIEVVSTHLSCNRNIEILTLELSSCSITSVYKPPNEILQFDEPINFNAKNIKIIIGDFNCHSSTWGYRTTNQDGENLELWAERKNLKLLHDPKLPTSFYSARWKKSYNPDNIFVSDSILQQSLKKVEAPIPRTQHRPIACLITSVVRVDKVTFRRRFNFKKAKWNLFSEHIDNEIKRISPDCESYEEFVDLVHKTSRKFIPRGCRTTYIPGLDNDSKQILEQYKTLFHEDPFSEQTIQAGENLISSMSQIRRNRWGKLLENIDLKNNSRRAWRLIKNLSNDPTKPKQVQTNVTANQIAHQLLLNGKTNGKVNGTKIRRKIPEENDFISEPLTMNELIDAIDQLKTNKAAGLDEIRTEQIKYFGSETMKWLLKFYNNCISQLKIPKIWRKSHVVALLKPGKEPDNPKNFRPVALLSHFYKLLERLILNRISSFIDENLIKEQAGFRPGKSCCSQILNLTQHIEDGYEAKKVTGVTFIDLSAAYDTVNHKKLVKKVYDLTKDYKLTKFIECILGNRRFHVTLGNEKSRWRNQKNGLPQGSVLSPILYNIYTNDIPHSNNTRKFIYADDTAIATQADTFEEVEVTLTKALSEMSIYYKENHLKPNPSKTQVCAFHLKNQQADRKLKVRWEDEELENCKTPKYLGVKLDRTLSYKVHCKDTKMKVMARNNILRKLTGTSWGARPETLRTSATALCLSTAEYAAPVWKNSAHAKEVDVAVNAAVRIVSGCLKPSPVEKIYPIVGIAPPQIRRIVASEIERSKQAEDERHPLHGHTVPLSRLKSRRSFLKSTEPLTKSTKQRKEELWRQACTFDIPGKEEISPGFQLPYASWKTLNRLRVGVSRCKKTLANWGYSETQDDILCDCGELQDEAHLLVCNNIGTTCNKYDLDACTATAIKVAEYWKNDI